MNILITGNFNNFKRMVVMLYSLFMQETGEVNVYIPVVKTDDENLRYLSMYVGSWQGKRLIPVYTDKNIWSMSEDNRWLSIEEIYTLCSKLDKNIQRILCLDTDIVVKKSLDELYNCNMQGKVLAVCESFTGENILSLKDGSQFDTGIILVNLERLNEISEPDELNAGDIVYMGWDQYNLYPYKYYMDREAASRGELRFACREEIEEKSNNLEEFQRRYIDITKQLAKEAAVIHFTEESSPCNPERVEDEMYDSFDKYYEDIEGDALYQYRCVTGQVAGESSLPVLIYYGVTYCYNILNDILAQFGAAFRRKGMRVIYYDEQIGDVAGLSRYFGRRFKAVIGVQSYLFSVRLQSGEYIHDNILGPKFNIVLDHPVWLHSQLMNVPSDYYVLTHDNNYKKFIEKYYTGVAETFILPPGANQMVVKKEIDYDNRKYDVIFIGTYGDYKAKEDMINSCQEDVKAIAWEMVDILLSDCRLTYEEAFRQTLNNNGIVLGDKEFFDVFSKMTPVFHYVMYYTRYKVIESLLEAGVRVEIWGSSWRKSPVAGHSNLIIHDDITPEESYGVMADSKISLNIMAWHKGGFTERIANSMGAGAVLVTDETTYDDGALEDGVNYVAYNLTHLDELVVKIKELLEDEDKRKGIAARGREYTLKNNTWDRRVEDFLKLYEE